MSQSLMKSRRFAPLFWTQFLSAFNDNFLKNALVLLILFQVSGANSPTAGSGVLVTLAGAVFIAPFLFLSALGGQIADRNDKSNIARRLKLAEIGAAGLAVAGMALQSLPVLFAALFAFGVVSALFSPIKFGILPDHLEASELPKANAWVESGTFLAILGGTIGAGFLFATGAPVALFGPVMISLAVVCYLASRAIPATKAGAPDLAINPNIFASTWSILAGLRADPRLWRTALFNAWFWFVGATVLSVMPIIVKDVLVGNEMAVTYFLTVFAVAVGLGSAVAAWLCAGRVVLLPAVIGTVLMGLFCLDLFLVLGALDMTAAPSLTTFLAQPEVIRVSASMAGLAFSGALLVVPAFSALQTWAKAERRARTVAGANALSAGFMTIGGLVLAGSLAAGFSAVEVLAGLAALNAAAAVLMLKFLPTNPLRDLVSIIYRAVFRLRVEGAENLEKAGEAPILALNHTSFLDAGLALTLTEKAPTFAIDTRIAKAWWVRPFLKLATALPLDPTNPLAMRSLINVVKSGEPMAIFPEGRLTVTGGLMKVYDGAAMVADKTGAKIVPIRIDGLQKTHFTRLSDAQVRKSWFPKVKVTIMEPQELALDPDLKGRARRSEAGSKLYAIMSDLMFTTSLDKGSTVLDRVIAAGKEHGMRTLASEDPVTGPMSYGKLLTGTAVLARKLAVLTEGEKTLGVMLPTANGSVVTTLAVMSAGKVPAMMNFTAGTTNILSACQAAEVKTILSSRAFVAQAKLEAVVADLEGHVRFLWLDELRQTISLADKLKGLLTRTRPLVPGNSHDTGVILFTSGSEGAPKGVVLTHRNILANATQAAASIDFNPTDKVFNVLPVFHSFGLTAGTILPLISGVPTYLYPSPLHYRVIPELIYSSNATILFGTDTFLNGYARVAHGYDFRSVRYCFAGAEPVRASTRALYMEKFGVRVLEGYGVTETAPVIAINTPMHNKPGTVGRLMPGMQAYLEPVPGVDDGGRLMIAGPNVMAGYVKADQPGVLQPLVDGWHDTGDIVSMDSQGFITIKGRAKRFAKIGGEMVSLAAVEGLAADVWSGELSAAATVSDPRKGERILLFTEAEGADRAAFNAFAKANGAQDLMVPAEVHVVDTIPVLGSGKVDFAKVAEVARAYTQPVAA
ncbi:MAG: acyl-[ACP]--phospholipid O-acyltransferase [Rhizobiales bacterium]|nr:acyl-[ACP]--phospholipid O-acyltransferase [Hyphomicrobiales bacterium]MBO6697488.1 acyl-[ACP]--phospholipid O-acyltransferase [Hyphomicrobiales bacterium]MBO6736257.1 acyl-[ACP]--phospholipid O-acyltransferase [Hyphomicrobiales bacterium]MBO6912727.1 acyl-[ACP]--phospholipid O-acyltransferase [Hyphomicrobiales bacterium]MBO6953896.1 acyl-[ACP]--phospholipid O-acyltransferase [Hyphomicrobiales bacterium]